MRKKVTIVGAGNVGATAAHWIAAKELADVVLIDVVEGVPQGKALDLLQAMPIEKRDCIDHRHERLCRHGELGHRGDYGGHRAQAGDEPRRSAEHELQDHVEVVGEGGGGFAECDHSSWSRTRWMRWRRRRSRRLGFPRERVIGMAGVLDSARFRTFIAEELKVSVENVTAFVLGGHGDTMVPLSRYSTVAGIPITELIAPERLKELETRTANGGAEIVKHLKTGSAYYAPSAAAVEMVEAILKDKKKILPCAAYLQGEYGISGLYVGVPCKLGAKGLEQIIEIKLTAEEQAALKKSADAVKELCTVIGVA